MGATVKTMIGYAALVAGIYGMIVGALYLFQRSLLYFPPPSQPSPAEAGLPEMAVVRLGTADGLTLRSWYAAPRKEGATVVYFCGNAGNLGYRAFKARPFLEAGYGMLLVAYRGFGNPGRPTEEGLYADGRAALDFLKERGIGPESTVLFGESLGSGIAVKMAAEQAAAGEPAAAVVLEAPFTSIADVARHHYPMFPVRWLVRDRFDSAGRIDGIAGPLLILHAEDDRVVPIRFGRRLFDAAAEPKEALWFESGGHEGLFEAGAAAAILDFLSRKRTRAAGKR